jgi:hypothetical protein
MWRGALPMSLPSRNQRRAGAWESAWVLAVLAVATLFAAGIGVSMALTTQDTEVLESPLLLSVARQLLISPWELYGPFGGENPLVLIHAPLYYRTAALLAWLIARAGLDPVTSALVAGRWLSVLSLVVTLVAVWRLARLDGVPARAGWLATFLFASASVVGSFPFAVRPDMLGIALQTTGILLLLSVLHSGRPSGAKLMVAFAAFGLAICVKQPFIAGPLVSVCLLLAAGRRGRVAFKSTLIGLLTALTVVLVIYGIEEFATQARMSQAVFLAASNVARVHPSDLDHTLIVLLAILGGSNGLIAILTASAVAMVSVDANLGRAVFVAAGTILVLIVFVLVSLEVAIPERSRGIYMLPALVAAVCIVLPVCAFLEPRSLARERLDRALWLYLAGELAVMVVLCRSSTGAWVNYAIPSVVIASVLTARVLDRALNEATSHGRLIPITLAASILPVGHVNGAYWSAIQRRTDELAKARIFRELGRPPSDFFFVGRPGDNRACGRLDLVYDDWLYPVFESIHLAEPRSIWLRRALTDGTVRFLVNTSDSPRLEGVGLTFQELGFTPRFQVGPFFVWERFLPPGR